MANDYELFEGKSLSSLFKDIYDNSKHNKTQLETLVGEVAGFIKDGDKLAGIVQRIIANENKGGSEAEFGLSDKEKEQLLKSIDDVVVDLQVKTDNITNDIEKVKEG